VTGKLQSFKILRLLCIRVNFQKPQKKTKKTPVFTEIRPYDFLTACKIFQFNVWSFILKRFQVCVL
jgi:hypothetical protein